jgi:hypothetical protein
MDAAYYIAMGAPLAPSNKKKFDIYHEFLEVCFYHNNLKQAQRFIVDRAARARIGGIFNSMIRYIYIGSAPDCKQERLSKDAECGG